MGPGTVPRLQPGLRLSWSERRDVAQRCRLDRNQPICWSCGSGGMVAWRPKSQWGDMGSFTQVTGVLNLSLAVGRFEGASQGREKPVPMYLVPSVEKGGCGSPPVQ